MVMGNPFNSAIDGSLMRMMCSACGSSRVLALINGKPYCYSCGSKILRSHMIRTLVNMKREGLVPSTLEIDDSLK